MTEKKYKIILISLVTVLVFLTSSFYYFSIDNAYKSLNPNNNSDKMYNSQDSSIMELGSTDYGTVSVEGPYGNLNSPLKIAFITGVHPLEFASHRAIVETVKEKDKSLNYCYYIYRVKVTRDVNDYDKGRMNGQLLANQFVVPHVIRQNYDFVIDVHSNQGKGEYSIRRFVFAPLDDGNSKALALKIMNKIPDLVYFNPSSQTSTQYVTKPIIKSGTPAIVYETYLYDSYEVTKKHAEDFLNAVDGLKI
ncbi:MAG: hypothetical protein ACXVHW_11510 [Methanobacterium sp.]